MVQIEATPEYLEWYEEQPTKIKGQIDARLLRISEYGHFGVAKHITRSISELKWKSGLRIYFAISIEENGNIVILLIGGNKNSQNQDIAMAKKLILKMSKE